MSGVCGSISERHVPSTTAERLRFTGDEVVKQLVSGAFSLTTAFHEFYADTNIVEEKGYVLCVWGNIYGYETGEGYKSFSSQSEAVTFCSCQYREQGAEFVSGLNGNFLIIIYDEEAEELLLITDRLGTHPVFYHTCEDAFLFASSIQALAQFPDVPVSWDEEYLLEYFALRRVLGCKTPIKGVEKLPPATVTAVDTDTGQVTFETYWRPVFEPVEKSTAEFVDEFTELFQDVVWERMREDREYGLLLSGGSDSRLILAAADKPITCYHMNEWMNEEAQTAKQVAEATGNEFVFLEREKDYQIQAVERNAPLMNFYGTFKQGHATGFMDEIDTDILLTGQYSDTLIELCYAPQTILRIPKLGNILLPSIRNIDSVEEYLTYYTSDKRRDLNTGIPSFVEHDASLRDILEQNITCSDDGCNNHGVQYPSLQDMILASEFYPITNRNPYPAYESLFHMMPGRGPFLDNRIIDFALRLPLQKRVRQQIIPGALQTLNPQLADIPHPSSGIGVDRHRYRHLFRYLAKRITQKVRPRSTPEPHYSHGSWTDYDELIEETGFVETYLRNHNDRFNSMVNWNKLEEQLEDGKMTASEAFPLLTHLSIKERLDSDRG